MPPEKSEVTRILDQWSNGDREALARLMPLVVDDLRLMARRYLAREPADHTLQPTALINEVYIRLEGRKTVQWRNRAHFFGSLAQIIRRILVDHARGRQTAKRGDGLSRVPLDSVFDLSRTRPPDLVALDDALRDLEEIDPRQSRIVELKFYVGLSNEQIADLLGLSPTTVKRDWRSAKLWLYRQLKERDSKEIEKRARRG